MNHIELRSSLNTTQRDAPFLEIGLFVDGNPLGAGLFIDLFELAKSCQSSGEMWIFSCSCGQPLDAGVTDGITVEHAENSMIWNFTDPISDLEIQDLNDEEYDAARKPMCFKFEPNSYQRNIDEGIRRIISLMVLGKSRTLSMDEREWERLSSLSTEVFSNRIPRLNRRLIAKRVDINAYHGGNIQVNGIYFSIEELGLPNELLAQFSQWRLLESFAQSKEDLPAYEKYLSAGRAFCSELKHYIGNGAVVKFKYHPPKCYNPAAWEITEEIR